jgi:hypothetical protein
MRHVNNCNRIKHLPPHLQVNFSELATFLPDRLLCVAFSTRRFWARRPLHLIASLDSLRIQD